VDDNDYQPPFRFTGKLDKLTIKLGPTQLADTDRQKAAEMIATAHDDR
jgi:arylsulfatase